MPEEKKIEWHNIKGSYIAMVGDQIIGIIDKQPDFPCEAWSIQPMAGMYANPESAKAEIELQYGLMPKQPTQPRKTLDQVMIAVLESTLAQLKAAQGEKSDTSERAENASATNKEA